MTKNPPGQNSFAQASDGITGDNNIKYISITMPLSYLGILHEHLKEGCIRDLFGQFYFEEKISNDNKTTLYYEGIDLNLITTNYTGKQS